MIDAYDPRLGTCIIRSTTKDVLQSIVDARELARTMGVSIRVKSGGSKFSSYRFGTIWLGKGFNSKPTIQQAKVLEHELVHARQAAKYRLWELQYLSPAALWRFEVEAFTQGWLCLRRLGATNLLERERSRIPDTLWEHYFPLRIYGRKRLRRETLEAIDRITSEVIFG